ncbi:hypothetical protein BOTCAL_0387g00120 [Botryotinia calthae]|uniref:SRR1-like domain-containing protein n=1 Tax=Botryotinia calthae TaxID=38488 RepID=A0A4Y8CR50_9HELO|nr:hypothetical protein BOTCAL_0387g00120 [Botryotinia calthae]
MTSMLYCLVKAKTSTTPPFLISSRNLGSSLSRSMLFRSSADYWRLVKEQPIGPTGTYHCSYLVEWSNQTVRNFRKSKEKQDQIFENNKLFWNNSKTCRALRSLLEELLDTRKVTKIIGFGLGDMCRKPPDRQNDLKRQVLNISVADRSMIQHSIALTMADACRNNNKNAIQLLAQDPDYSVKAMELLEKNDFKIVGQFGAGGFADIDEESVVFSPFVNAPVKQIIADIARPVLLISTGFEAFNDHEKPWADAESPRTEQMWQEYQSCDFPISSKEVQLMGELHKLKLYTRTAIGSACNQ